MYCAACLADGEPYFRLEWRLAFHTVCVRHSIILRDTCPHCGHPPWPAACGVASHLHPAFRNFAVCWKCSGALGQPASEKFAQPVIDALQANTALSHVPMIERFQGLRALCQLLLRRRAGRVVFPLYMSDHEAARTLSELANTRAIEELRVEVRDRLLRIGLDLLADWPSRFLTVCERAGVSRTHFNDAPDLPAFLAEVVDQSLAKQNRWVRRDDVLGLVSALRQEGVRVTKAEIRRRLRWQGDIPNDWLNFALLATLVLGSSIESQAAVPSCPGSAQISQSSGPTVPDIRRNFDSAQMTNGP